MKIYGNVIMKTPTRTIYVSQYANPADFADGEEYTTSTFYRIVADEGKMITNGDTVASVVDVENTDGWYEIDMPEETNPL